MIEDLLVIHRQGHSSELVAPVHSPWALWKTCLRQIAIGSTLWSERWPLLSNESDLKDQYFYQDDAYSFLLETICGLHSPMIGETEVYGQFRSFFSNYTYPQDPFGYSLEKMIQKLMADAKWVRQCHLVGLGSQSYGSVARRFFKHATTVHFLGAGHLVEEMLPWMDKATLPIQIYCRRMEQFHHLARKFPNLSYKPLSELCKLDLTSGLVVAAPILTEELQRLLQDARPSLLLDLRATSNLDPLKLKGSRILSLQEVFEDIENTRLLLAQRVSSAQREIGELTKKQRQHVDHRPFGWAEVCME